MQTNLSEYFQRVTGERSNRAIALRSGLEQTTVNRQLNGTSSLVVETVVAIARAYSLDFADTFAAVGFITEDEARSFGRRAGLEQFDDLELAREIVRRIEAGIASATLTDELDVDEDADANVPALTEDDLTIEQPERDQYDLVARRRKRKADELPYAE